MLRTSNESNSMSVDCGHMYKKNHKTNLKPKAEMEVEAKAVAKGEICEFVAGGNRKQSQQFATPTVQRNKQKKKPHGHAHFIKYPLALVEPPPHQAVNPPTHRIPFTTPPKPKLNNGNRGRNGKWKMSLGVWGMRKWHKKPFCAVLCNGWLGGSNFGMWSKMWVSPAWLLSLRMVLANPSTLVLVSARMTFILLATSGLQTSLNIRARHTFCLFNVCHLTVIAFAAIKQPQRQRLDFETYRHPTHTRTHAHTLTHR